jgi:hypothetical protein
MQEVARVLGAQIIFQNYKARKIKKKHRKLELEKK